MPEHLDRAAGLPAHRAGPDAYVTAHHLRDMLALAGLETLLAWSAEPALLVRVPFGPFRGRRWQELDDATLDQIVSGGNADVAFTLRQEKGAAMRRVGGGRASSPFLKKRTKKLLLFKDRSRAGSYAREAPKTG